MFNYLFKLTIDPLLLNEQFRLCTDVQYILSLYFNNAKTKIKEIFVLYYLDEYLISRDRKNR